MYSGSSHHKGFIIFIRASGNMMNLAMALNFALDLPLI